MKRAPCDDFIVNDRVEIFIESDGLQVGCLSKYIAEFYLDL